MSRESDPTDVPIGRFSLRSMAPVRAPSEIEARIDRMTGLARGLGAAALVSVAAFVGMVVVSAVRADVIAFVADGGIAGCEATVVGGKSR